jgi:hypothetical protein
MEQLNPYAVILHDPRLRKGLIAEAERSRRARHGSKPGLALRVWFAQALRGLATRVEPVRADAVSPRSERVGRRTRAPIF